MAVSPCSHQRSLSTSSLEAATVTGGRAGIRVLLAVYCRRRRHCITEVAVSPPSLCHCSRCCRRRRRRRRRRPVGDKNHGEAISERGSRSETILSAVGRSLLYRLQTYRAVSKSESKSRSKSPSARAPPPCSAPLPLRKEVEGCVICVGVWRSRARCIRPCRGAACCTGENGYGDAYMPARGSARVWGPAVPLGRSIHSFIHSNLQHESRTALTY